MPRKSAPPPTPVGAVVMMDKPAPKPIKPVPPPPPEPLVKEISSSKYEHEIRPKKPLSEKQQANLQKLIERNKAQAVARRVNAIEAIPEVIPEDKILVRIKPKRAYNRKQPEAPAPAPAVVPQKQEQAPKNTVLFPSDSEVSEASESEPEPEPRRRRKRAVKPASKPVKYHYETETTTADEDSDSDDDYKVAKYQMKADKRIKAVEKIDKRLQQLHTNSYQSRGLSVF